MKIIMGLNAPWIGGMRTHVMSLAQALIKRGHSLILVTDPGVLEDELIARGIPYVVRRKTTGQMVRMLAELVESERPDLIHAHPADFIFEGFLVSQLIGVPFMVTMHGEYIMHFTRDPLGCRIGSVVSKVIAVSEQIKAYLERHSVLEGERIAVIANGIDFGEFTPRPNPAELRSRFGIGQDEIVIMYLGRLDSDKAQAITVTVGVVDLLYKFGEAVKGVLVGQGDQLDFLAGRKNLVLTGFRRNIPELLSMADVVVATGRSVLEALACGKPVIAIGRAGLHGLITVDNWEQAVKTNFGDHGCLRQPDLSLVLAYVKMGLAMSEEERLKLRQLTQGRFDLLKVVSELEQVYAMVAGMTR